MTIKRRLFISNILMLIIPIIVSVIAVGIAAFIFWNIIYKNYMNEAYEDKNFSHMCSILVEQSENFLEEIGEDEFDEAYSSKSFTSMESYLNSNNTRLDIMTDGQKIYSIGNWNGNNSEQLFSAIQLLGGEGSVSADNMVLFAQKVYADNQEYTIYIYSHEAETNNKDNEILLTNIVIVLIVLAVVAVLVTNRFLTRFVFRKIEQPLDILADGVHQIRDGNVDYQINYKENDEFYPICNDFNDMAARLKKSVEDTNRNEQNRKELIAGISHDIRTPLTSVKAYIEGLIEGVAQTPEKQQKYMKTILAKANDIDGMVDKLFLFSKLDLGEYPFYPEEFDVCNEIKKLAQENASDYVKKGLLLNISNVTESAIVYADPVQFRSAVTNILENSLKYKESETVTAAISCENCAETVKISIEDNGPGVNDEALPKLFDVFYRGDPSRNNPHKGSGLGLAITAKILEHFGGSIYAENVQPHGLKIVMIMPKKEQ